MSIKIEYTRIVKIGNMYFEEVDPKQTFTLTRIFTLEEAVQLGCKGYLNEPMRRVTKTEEVNVNQRNI